MNFEISPKEYWKIVAREETELYCQLLNIDGKNDWRLPTYPERQWIRGYFGSDVFQTFEVIIKVIPVRDI